jgi:hypothetical protein
VTDDNASGLSAKRPSQPLRFVVELVGEAGAVERVLGRAHSAAVAQAVFRACSEEYPGRLLTLREGRREIARTALSDKVG